MPLQITSLQSSSRLALALSGVLFASVAHGQAAPPDRNSAGMATDVVVPAVLGEIVVTARKQSEEAQHVPIAVTALSGAELQRSGITEMTEAVKLVPGIQMSRATGDAFTLNFRGLGTTARPQAFEQSVAMFVDGVFMGKSIQYTTSIFDIERLELIKGTQSTLLGKNSSEGAISVIPRKPKDKFSLDASAGYDLANGGYLTDVGADLPVSPTLKTRLAVHWNDQYGGIRNTVDGQIGPIDKDLGLRATVVWDPFDALGIDAFYQYSNNRRIGSSWQLIGALPAGYGSGQLDDTQAMFTPGTRSGESEDRIKMHVGTIRANWDLGGAHLVAQTAYTGYRASEIDDLDFSKDPTVEFDRYETYRQFTQELRMQPNTSAPFQYAVGVLYMSNHWTSYENQVWAVPGFPPPPSPISGQLYNGSYANNFVQSNRSYSAFVSGKYSVFERLNLAAGLRYTYETKSGTYGRTVTSAPTIWNTIANPPFDPTGFSHRSNFLDGNISLLYQASRNINIYAAMGHGSKSGGLVETNSIAIDPALLVNGNVPAALVTSGAAIKDEHTTSYEVGIKSELFNRRARVNIAIFDIDVKNFQDTVFTGGPLGFLTTNSPARSRGAEIDTAFQLSRALRLDAAYSFIDATTIIQPIVNNALLVDAAGNAVYQRFRRTQAPMSQFNIGADYSVPLTSGVDVRLGAKLRYRSGMFNQRQEQFHAAPLTTLDLSAGVKSSDGRWTLDVVAKNVANALSAEFSGPAVDPRFTAQASANTRRSVMLTAGVHF